MKTVFALLIAVVVAAGGAAYYVHNNRAEKTSFRTALIERGELAITIDASGTLQPEEVVDVGAQITGKILSFGPDADRPGKSVDFCSTVRKDQLLANIDPTYYQAKVEQCKAALKKSEAELEQMKANCAQAKNAWERAKELRPLQAIADSDYDAAEANYLVALANIAVGEAGLRQAKAALDMAEVDLGYTVIRSPIDGEIIKRRVNVG
ncbi:MAG: RND transporter, partial [Pirellulaceae bacterium]|nr:RND transporter [Pirellulaceae bacterium]